MASQKDGKKSLSIANKAKYIRYTGISSLTNTIINRKHRFSLLQRNLEDTVTIFFTTIS